MKSLGATHFIDRKADVPAEVKKIVGDQPIHVVYDAVSFKSTQAQSLDIIETGGQVISVLGVLVDKKEYPNKNIVTVFGNVHVPNVRALGVSLYSKLTELLASGTIKVCFNIVLVRNMKVTSPPSRIALKCCQMVWRVSLTGSSEWNVMKLVA